MKELPEFVPKAHRGFMGNFVGLVQSDERIVGVAVGGSFLTGQMDEYSDIDLVIAVEPNAFDAVMQDRMKIAEAAGRLLAAFTGEHVGEPRLLICLYDKPLLHVDLKFLVFDDLAERVEDPAVLWERDGQITKVLASSAASYPAPKPQWIEDRFWIWVHYVAAKIGRGELFEALDGLAFIRKRVLGPLCFMKEGLRPAWVRKIEMLAPSFADQLRGTVAIHDARDCLRALRSLIKVYQSVRAPEEEITWRRDAERAVMGYVDEIERGVG